MTAALSSDGFTQATNGIPAMDTGDQAVLGSMPGLADIEVVGQAGTGAEVAGLAGTLCPDVVVLTTFDDDEYVYAALRAGASGFLVKDMALEEILAAVRTVAVGDALIALVAPAR